MRPLKQIQIDRDILKALASEAAVQDAMDHFSGVVARRGSDRRSPCDEYLPSARACHPYLCHRGFSLVSKMILGPQQSMLFAYLSSEVIDEAQYIDNTDGLEPYFVCPSDIAMPLDFAQRWCDARLSGRPNFAKFPI